MENQLMELVANYQVYAEAEELNVSAVTDAPATSTPCIATLVSSSRCVAATIGATIATATTYNTSC